MLLVFVPVFCALFICYYQCTSFVLLLNRVLGNMHSDYKSKLDGDTSNETAASSAAVYEWFACCVSWLCSVNIVLPNTRNFLWTA